MMGVTWFVDDNNDTWQAIKKLGDDVLKMQQKVENTKLRNEMKKNKTLSCNKWNDKSNISNSEIK